MARKRRKHRRLGDLGATKRKHRRAKAKKVYRKRLSLGGRSLTVVCSGKRGPCRLERGKARRSKKGKRR